MSLDRQPFLNLQNLSCSQKLCKNQDHGDSFFIFPSFHFLAFPFFFSFSLIAQLILCLKEDPSFLLLVLKWLPLKSQITLSDGIFNRCLRLFSLPSQFFVDSGHQNGPLFMTFSGDLYFMLFVVFSYY